MMNFAKSPKRLTGKKLALLALAIGVALQGSVSYALEPVKIGRPSQEGVDTRLISEDSETHKKGVKDSAGNTLEPVHKIISIGCDSHLNISASMAFGHSAKSLGKSGRDWGNTAVGIEAVANTMSVEVANKDNNLFGHATAFGYQSKATGHRSTALGAAAVAEGESAIAIGVCSASSGYRSIAVGDYATTVERNSMAIGYGSTASEVGSIAIGDKASSLGRGAIALGHGATLKNDPSGIVIGNHAFIDNSKSEDPGHNIAMGVAIIENGKGNVCINGVVNSGSATAAKSAIGNIVISNAYTAATKTRSNGQANIVIGESASNNGHFNLVIGRGAQGSATDGLALGELAKVSAYRAGAIGFNAEAKEFGAYAIGQNSEARNFNSVALGSNSKTGNKHTKDTAKTLLLAGQKYTFAGLSPDVSGTLSVGRIGQERQIQNVAAGDITALSTDAVNGSQLHAANTAINNLAKTLGDSHMVYGGDMGAATEVKLNKSVKLVGGVTNENLLSDNNIGVVSSQDGDDAKLKIKLAKNLWGMESVTFGEVKTKNPVSLSSKGLSNGGNKITNVGNGEVSKNSTDAVNGRQLYKAIVDSGAKVKNGTNTTVTNSTNPDGSKTYTVDVNDNVTFGKDDKAINVNGQEGKVTVGKGEQSVTVDGTQAKVTAGKVVLDGKKGNVTAGKVAIDGEKGKVTAGNVALDGANGTVTGLTNRTWDEKKVVPGQAATEDQLKAVSEKLGDVEQKAGQHTSVSVNKGNGKGPLVLKVGTNNDGSANYDVSLDLKIQGDASDNSKLSDGNIGVVKEGESSYTVKLAKDLKDLNSVSANKVSAQTVTANTVTATTVSGDTLKAGDTVTISRDGIDAGSTKVTNILAGELSARSADAVNGAQLYETNQAVSKNADDIDKLGHAHRALDTRVNKVGAGAAALAALHPLDFDPNDKWNIATGTGSYRGQHALALGAFYRPDEDTMFNIASELGNGNNMWSVGVSFKFGRDKNNPAGRAHMAREIVRLKAVNDTMQGEHQNMKAELSELKVKLEQLMKNK
jgi:autotransporter adhesin